MSSGEKEQMRAQSRRHRKELVVSLSEAEKENLGREICLQFCAGIHVSKNMDISIYWSIHDEIDTTALIRLLCEDGYKVSLPRIVSPGFSLDFHRYMSGDDLIINRFGIKEPQVIQDIIIPDVVIVPMLAFDKYGHRLGYGRGYYDRTIHQLRQKKDVTVVGLAYDQQEIEKISAERFDEKMDYVITPTRVLKI